MDKVVSGYQEAIRDLEDGAVVMLDGFGAPPGLQYDDHGILFENRQVRRVIASFPVPSRPSHVTPFVEAFRAGEVELEVVPQGTLAERIRAGGAGIPAFYTPTGAGTMVAEGKETRVFDGREYVLERALTADFALLRAFKADHLGNLVYRGTSRNFNAVMATAARTTVVEADHVVVNGTLDPDSVVTPGIYVHRVVQRPDGEA